MGEDDLLDHVYQMWHKAIGDLSIEYEVSDKVDGLADLYVRTGIGTDERDQIGSDVNQEIAMFLVAVSHLMPDIHRAWQERQDYADEMERERDNAIAGQLYDLLDE